MSGNWTPASKAEWEAGFKEGYEYTVANFKLGRNYNAFPEKLSGLRGSSGVRGNGFAEGVISGTSFVIDRDYPGWRQISIRTNGRYDIVFKDGHKNII